MKETSSFQSLDKDRSCDKKGCPGSSLDRSFSFLFKHAVRHAQRRAQRLQFYTFGRCSVLSLSSSAVLLSASSAGQGVAVRTIMPFAAALGQEVCVWVSPGCLCMGWTCHCTRSLSSPVTSRPRGFVATEKQRTKTNRYEKSSAVLTGISFGLKLLPESYSVCLTSLHHLELNVKLCIIILD